MRIWVALAAGLAIGGCAGGRPVAAGPEDQRRDDGVRLAERAELGPPPTTREMVLWLRVTSAVRDLPVAANFLAVPLPIESLLAEPAAALHSLLGETAARLIDLERPTDFVGTPDTEPPSFTASFTVRQSELSAVAANLERVGPGRWRLPSEKDEVSCELWHTARAGYRVLCDDNPAVLKRRAPLLLGDLVLRQVRGSFRAEMLGQGYKRQLLAAVSEVEAEEPATSAGERAGQELGNRAADALLAHDALGIEVDFTPKGIEVGCDLLYSDTRDSPLFAAWLAAASQAPASPFRLPEPPGDGLQIATPGLAGGAARRLAEPFGAAILAAMKEDFANPEGEFVEALDDLAAVLPTDGRFTLAVGRDGASLEQALSAPTVSDADGAGRALEPADISRLSAALEPWFIVGLEQAPGPYLEAVVKAVKTWQKPVIRRSELGAGEGKPARPGASAANPEDDDEDRVQLRLVSTPVAGLPAGTLHVVYDVKRNPSYRPPAGHRKDPLSPYQNHYFVVPDENRVWIVGARAESAAAGLAQAVIARRTARARSSTQAPAWMFGSVSMEQLAALALEWRSREEREEARRMLSLVTSLPQRGRARIPFSVSVVAEPGKAGTYRLRVSSLLTREAVLDLVQLAEIAESEGALE